MSVPASQRLFFALWPDAAVRAQLAALLPASRDRNSHPVPAANLHLTLAFLGNQSCAQRDCVEAAVARMSAAGFELVIDSLGYWSRQRIVWAGMPAAPSALMTLVEQLNQALASCGYQREHRIFHPHITLARKAVRPPAQTQIPAIVWQAREFCLVASILQERGSEYRVIGRWPLHG